MTTERITDDQGDELEHGEPDFPGQFPDPTTREDPVSQLENDIRELRGAEPGERARRLIERGWSLAASPADGAGLDVEEDADKP
jgi:hypothetical protein